MAVAWMEREGGSGGDGRKVIVDVELEEKKGSFQLQCLYSFWIEILNNTVNF